MNDEKITKQVNYCKELKLEVILSFIVFLIGFGIYPIFIRFGIITLFTPIVAQSIALLLLIMHFAIAGKLFVDKLKIYQTEKQILKKLYFNKTKLQGFLYDESQLIKIEKRGGAC